MEKHQCTKCGEVKPLTTEYYSKRKDTKFGWRKQCIKCCTSQKREYRNRPENKSKEYERSQKWRKENVEWVNSYYKKWDEEHKEEKKISNAKRFQERKHIIAKIKKERYHTDTLFKLQEICRKRLYSYLKNQNKSNTTKDMIGCTWEQLKEHIESQFTEGMTWYNHAQYGWHIDHIIPLGSAKTEEEVYKLSHYTNLQPLWWEDNLKKSDKII